MPPPSSSSSSRARKRIREVEVLDEDSYVEAIEAIVERDFFPDLPRLQDRLEWLEAIRTADPELIRAAQARIMARRAGRKGSSGAGTPSRGGSTPSTTAGTPRLGRGTPIPAGMSSFQSPFSVAGSEMGTPAMSFAQREEAAEAQREQDAAKRARSNMSLDEFLLRHTSEDNASFNALKEKENKKRREKVKHLYLLEGPGSSGSTDVASGALSGAGSGDSMSTALAVAGGADRKALAVAGSGEEKDIDRKIDGYGSTGQALSTLKHWPFKAKNELMYDSSTRDDVPLTQAELAERAMGPPKEVKHRNTRFQRSQIAAQEQAERGVEDKVAILYSTVPGETPQRSFDPYGERGSKKHYDLEDLRRTPAGAGAGAGAGRGAGAGDGAGDGAGVESVNVDGQKAVYDYVGTPSFTPGVGPDASPFMTWGDIDGTPLRLEAEDTPVGIGGAADGPHFQIPTAGARDETAMNMSRAAARSLKQRKQTQGGSLRGPHGLSPSPSVLSRGMSPSLRGSRGVPMSPAGSRSPGIFSPAAQRLASQAARSKGGGAFDATLRASYASSPMRSPSGASRQSSAKKLVASALSRSRGGSHHRESPAARGSPPQQPRKN